MRLLLARISTVSSRRDREETTEIQASLLLQSS